MIPGIYNFIVKIFEVINIKKTLKKIILKVKFFRIPISKPQIIKLIPHSLPNYTQGLYHEGNHLYESTGLYGRSSLKKINTADGTLVKIISMDAEEFTEGIACINNTLIQLTWKSGAAFVYDIPELIRVGRFDYGGEGWGMTSKNDCFIMSDGSQYLFYRNIEFKKIKKKSVFLNSIPLKKINDLAYYQNKIYANVLSQDYIYRICEESGRVDKIYDCTTLRLIDDNNCKDSALNGIAYDSISNLFYVTGKNWKYIFQIKLS